MRLLSGRSRLRCSRRLVTVFATLALSTHTAVAQRATSGRPETAGASCRQTVFAGLAVDCNLNGAGSELACCATLRGAEQNRCFCDAELVTLVSSVIGEQGLNFFRQFALERCGTRLTENDACFANSGVREGNGNFGAAQQVLRPVQATQVPSVETPQEDYEYEAGDGDTAPVTDTPGLIPPPVSNVLPGQQEGTVPGFPPASADENQALPGEVPETLPEALPPPTPFAPFPPASPPPPPPPNAPPPSPSPPPFGTPGAAPQLSIPPPAPQIRSDFGSPPPFAIPTRRKIPGLPTIAETVSSPKLNRETGFFADALKATGLLRLFDGDGPYTVFVPTNRAWYAMLVNLGVTKEDLFEDPSLTEVLLHHATRREIFSQQMFFGQKIPTLHMSAPSVSRALRAAVNAGMDPSSASVALTETLEVETFTNIIRKAFFVNGCDVLTKDKQASNGLIHVIDCVLLPPAPQPLPTGRTVAQVIVERFELSIFEQALQGSGLLNAIKQATPTNPLTVFAPTNAAFLKYVATSPGFFIDTAAERLVNPQTPGLQETLLYHFVPARLQSAQLKTRLGNKLRTFEGNDVFVEEFNVQTPFQKTTSKLFVNGCRVRAVDLLCVDGVVHTVECVLQPNFRDDPEKLFGDTE